MRAAVALLALLGMVGCSVGLTRSRYAVPRACAALVLLALLLWAVFPTDSPAPPPSAPPGTSDY